MERFRFSKVVQEAKKHARHGVAAVSLATASILVACTGKGNVEQPTPTEPPQTPTAEATFEPSPTATAVVPTEAPTVAPTEVPTAEPTPTPDIIPEVDPVEQVNKLIGMVQNFDGSLYEPDVWEFYKTLMIDGVSPQEDDDIPGLKDVQAALLVDDYELALSRMNNELYLSVSRPLATVSGETEPKIFLVADPDPEYLQYDPEKKFLTGEGSRLSLHRWPLTQEWLILYYNIYNIVPK